MFEIEEETKWEKVKDFLYYNIWFYISEPFKNWIYPAYKVRRLCDRHDIVKLPGLKATEWCDVVERMYRANMELIKYFIEVEKPEDHVMWYDDEKGKIVGHIYGECEDNKGWPTFMPEYKDMYILDIVKMIYVWYTAEQPRLEEESRYLLHFWAEYLYGKPYGVKLDNGCSEYKVDKSAVPTSMSFFADKNINWFILDKYVDGDRKNVLKEGFISDKMRELDEKIELEKQKMLHLCTEVRMYLWT